MFGAFLAIVGLAGGTAITYFIMDTARRKYVHGFENLKSARRELEDDIEEYRAKAKRQIEFEKQLNRRDERLIVEERTFAQARTAFAERAIEYGTLQSENRILRSELKNAGIHTAYLEHMKDSSRMSESVIEIQRNTLGKNYFDEVTTNSKRSLTLANYVNQKRRVQSVASRLREIGFLLPPTEEESVLWELHNLYLKAIQADSDRKDQTRIKEVIKDEERQQREAEEAIEQAESEKRAIEERILLQREAMARAMDDVGGKHAAELASLQVLLAESEAKSIRVKSNAEMGIKHGHVYVISNIGSFGEGVFKIGMTRRTEPLDRVKELGDASVPFPFDVHMMIKCDNAPRLESELHRAFSSSRLNKVNPRKEFFRVKFDDILTQVEEHHGKIDFVAEHVAEQFRTGLTMTEEEIDELYEEAAPLSALELTE